MRYVQKQLPAAMIDPSTGEPGELVTFDCGVQLAVLSAMQKAAADALTLIAVHQRFAAAKELEWVPVEE